jgi:hypothetical protein
MSCFSVFRELLQNSDDAESPTVEVHFETAAYLDRRDRREEILDVPTLPDLKSTSVLALGPSHAHVFADHIFKVTQWTFRNNGKTFTDKDWKRLPKIGVLILLLSPPCFPYLSSLVS